MSIHSGEVILNEINSGNVWNPWVLANGGSAVTDIKAVMRLAFQSSGSTAHFQMRYYDTGGSVVNSHNLTQDVSGFKAWNLYAFFGGLSGGNRYFQVAEYDVMTGAVTQMQVYAPASGADSRDVTGTRLYVNPPISTSAGLGSAQADVTHTGCDYVGLWLKEGSECAGGNFGTVADMFVKPDGSDVTFLSGFHDGSGQSVVADEANSNDITIAGTEYTDFQWIGGKNEGFDISDNSAPAGSYVGQDGDDTANPNTGVEFDHGRVTLHSSTNNGGQAEDPEIGFGGTSGAGPWNIKNDVFRVIVDASDTPAGWMGSGNTTSGEGGITCALRDDINADGTLTGSRSYLFAAQFNAGASTVIVAQRQVPGETIASITANQLVVDPTDGTFMHEFWGDDTDIYIRTTNLSTGDWHVLYDSDADGEDASGTPSSIGGRNQSKNRTNATSTFTGTQETWIDNLGSTMVGLWTAEALEDVLVDEMVYADVVTATFVEPFAETVTDTIDIEDAIVATIAIPIPDDTIQFSDSVSTEFGFLASLTDSVTFADAIIADFQFGSTPLERSQTDVMVFADAILADFQNTAVEKAISDGLVLSDNVIATFQSSNVTDLNIADGLVFSDAIDATFAATVGARSNVIVDYRIYKPGASNIARFEAVIKMDGDRPFPLVSAESITLKVYNSQGATVIDSPLNLSCANNSRVTARLNLSALQSRHRHYANIIVVWPGSRTEVLGTESLIIEASEVRA